MELKKGEDYRIVGDLEMTDNVMNNSFWIGVYPGMRKEMIDYMIQTIREYVGQYAD
jgi:CDP-6-deoxy-D-xylo-4-hexulose-3-dehydrase